MVWLDSWMETGRPRGIRRNGSNRGDEFASKHFIVVGVAGGKHRGAGLAIGSDPGANQIRRQLAPSRQARPKARGAIARVPPLSPPSTATWLRSSTGSGAASNLTSRRARRSSGASAAVPDGTASAAPWRSRQAPCGFRHDRAPARRSTGLSVGPISRSASLEDRQLLLLVLRDIARQRDGSRDLGQLSRSGLRFRPPRPARAPARRPCWASYPDPSSAPAWWTPIRYGDP